MALINWVAFALCLVRVWGTYADSHRDGSLVFHHHYHHYMARQEAYMDKKSVAAYETWLERVRRRQQQKEDMQSFLQSDATENRTINKDGILNVTVIREEIFIKVNSVQGLGNFTTIQAAVDSVPKGNKQRVVIEIAAGVYTEKVKIPRSKPFITLAGEGMDVTKVTWNDTAARSSSTFRSATVSVMAEGFVARGIAFENSAPPPIPGAIGGQAVAFQISGDQSAFYDCAFYGAQDTLYDHKGRHYFQNCWIQGSIDFIFGDGLSLYEGCQLHTIDTNVGSLTAQKRRSMSDTGGFAFLNCSISGAGTVYLGRAWGAYSRVVFIYTFIDDIILPGGWDDWGISSRQQTSFYGEFDCFGPGSNLQTRVTWSHALTLEQAAPFMSISFIDGQYWIPTVS